MNNKIFEDLFVLELANNHWGKRERGIRIIEDFAKIVRFNNVRAAIKLQFRNVPTFIHKDFKERQDIRYIKKTIATKSSWMPSVRITAFPWQRPLMKYPWTTV